MSAAYQAFSALNKAHNDGAIALDQFIEAANDLHRGNEWKPDNDVWNSGSLASGRVCNGIAQWNALGASWNDSVQWSTPPEHCHYCGRERDRSRAVCAGCGGEYR